MSQENFLKNLIKKIILFFSFKKWELFGMREAVQSSLQTTVHLTLCYINCRPWRKEAQKGNTYFPVIVFSTCSQLSEPYLLFILASLEKPFWEVRHLSKDKQGNTQAVRYFTANQSGLYIDYVVTQWSIILFKWLIITQILGTALLAKEK